MQERERSDDFVARVETALRCVVALLRCYSPLANAHANDFLIVDSWNRMLSVDIQKELLAFDDVLDIPRAYLRVKEELLSNEELRKATIQQLLQLSEEHAVEPETFTVEGRFNKLASPRWVHSNLRDFLLASAVCSLEVSGVLSKTEVRETGGGNLQEVFVSHGMGVKKAHEIELMSTACGEMCAEHGIGQVVDIGSGKGYLGTYLYLAHTLSVVEVDARPSNSDSAVKRRESLMVKWPHLLRKARETQGRLATNEKTPEDLNGVERQCISLTSMITSSEQLDTIVRDYVPKASNGRCLITGLHTCGGLASTILRTFVQSSRSQALVNLGCCYHFLEEAHFRNPFLPNDAQPPGLADFPMSACLRREAAPEVTSGRRGFALGRNARIIASQSIERIVDPEEEKTLHVSMFYRVVLQRILLDHLGRVEDEWVVGKLGRKTTDFPSYVRAGIAKLGFTDLLDKLSEREILSYTSTYASVERQLFSFYLIRCTLAPVVEACVLLDRLLFLLDHVGEAAGRLRTVRLERLFTPKMSPRCFALVGVKE